jgi:hypothetical protein
LPVGRAFSRRLYLATAKAKKTHQLNKVTKEMYEDLLMLKYFSIPFFSQDLPFFSAAIGSPNL